MFDTAVLLPLIPGLPLAAAVLTPILGFTVLRRAAHLPALIGMILACIFSCMLLANVSGQPSAEGEIGYSQVYTLWTWADVEGAYSKQPPPDAATDAAAPGGRFDFDIEVALRADTLTAVMLVMVTFISTLVVIFSIGYMHGDPGYWRFFSYVSLFVFSMSMLVSVSNFLLLFVFWEAVGVCSYLLIGFWYQKPSAAAAGQKAFLVNRVGDFGFMLGVLDHLRHARLP